MKLVDLGAVRGAYGIKGWVKIAPFSPDADVLLKAREWWLNAEGQAPRALQVQSVRRHGATVVAKWEGFEVPEQCNALKGTTVAVDRAVFAPLPKGQWYWVDLIGARVLNRAEVVLGQVSGVQNNGAQDLMEVKPLADSKNAGLLIPMISAYVDEVNVDQGVVRVDWELDWS